MLAALDGFPLNFVAKGVKQLLLLAAWSVISVLPNAAFADEPVPVENQPTENTVGNPVPPPPNPGQQSSYEGYVVNKITIITSNVFNPNIPAENGFIGNVGNKVHIVTRESVIRNELLFAEGDPYDKHLVEETARNLRKRQFLTDVSILPVFFAETKTVDITIRTRDQWTLIGGTTIGGTSNNGTYGANVGEQNLLGFGQNVSYSISEDNSGISQSAGFSDPNFMGSRYSVSGNYNEVPMEINKQLSVQKPYYSLDTKDAHGIYYTTTDHSDSANKNIFNSYRLICYMGWASIGPDSILRTNAILSLGQDTQYNNSYQPTTVTLDNKAEMTFEWLGDPRNFAKDSYILKFRETEDIQLGVDYTLLVGQSLVALSSSSSYTTLGVTVKKWTQFNGKDYLYANFALAEHDDNFNQHKASLQVQYYFRQLLQQTIVVNFQGDYLDNQRNIFEIGGVTGLRGYAVNEFVGTNRMLFNLEDRIFTYKSMFADLVEPGFVIFADAGDAWSSGNWIDNMQLHSDIGVGLRFALLKAPGISTVRIDFGVPTDFKRPPSYTIGMQGFF
jgi:hypothetical protein